MDHRIVPVAEAEQQLGQLQVGAWQLGGRRALTSQPDGHPQIGDRGGDVAGVKAERPPHDEQVRVGRGYRLSRLGQPFGQPGQARRGPMGGGFSHRQRKPGRPLALGVSRVAEKAPSGPPRWPAQPDRGCSKSLPAG